MVNSNNVTTSLDQNGLLEDKLNNIFSTIDDPAMNEPIFNYTQNDISSNFTLNHTSLYKSINTQKDPIMHKPSEMEHESSENSQANVSSQDNYIIEVPEKKSFFEKIRSSFSNIFKRFTQKSLPDPNVTKAKHTNMSFEDYDRKYTIMSAIRSMGDRITNATRNTFGKNNKKAIKNNATIISPPTKEDIPKTPTTPSEKDIISPKLQPTRTSNSFDQYVLHNEGNKLEHNAMANIKANRVAQSSKSKSSISVGQTHSTNPENSNEKGNDGPTQ